MDYSFFLDETGDHGLSFVDKNFPLFLLCGCVLREDALKKMEKELISFKQKYFQITEVVLHSRDIRKCEGAFQILFDLNLKAEFYQDLNQILSKGRYLLIGAGVQKEEHVKKYGKGAKDPYSLSLSFVLERLIFYLDKTDPTTQVEIFAEERGKKEDQMLLSHFNSILDLGTYYVQPVRFKKRIKRFTFHNKKENTIGLQIADLCAYPLARHILNPSEPYIPFKIIEDKIYCKNKGEYEGWGLKIFP